MSVFRAPALGVVLLACGVGRDSGVARDSAVRGVSPSPPELPAPEFAGTTARTVVRSSGAAALLVAVRAATHPEYERVAFEFRGVRPGYAIEYLTEPPTDCGSGERVSVAGDAYLSVRLEPANAHEFIGERARATVRDRNRRIDFPVMRTLRLTCDFEAVVTWVVGLSSRRPYRVLTLDSPPRLVVDVSTP